MQFARTVVLNVLAAMALVAPWTASAADNIVIGVVACMTGEQATFGDSTDKGVKLAVDEQNKKGGIKGKQLVQKTLDDQGKPEEAAVAATRLITQDKAAIIIGEIASSRSMAVAPIADANKVPQISPTSTNPKVTKDGTKTRPYVFRVCFIDPFQGTVMAKFAANNLKVKKVAIMRDVSNDYSVGLADFFTEAFKKAGGTIVSDQSFKDSDSDFKAQLTQIKGKNPEAIFVPGYYNAVALIARQARELQMKQPLLGGDGWDSPQLFEISKGALNGSFFANHYAPEDPSPAVQDFVKKYQAAYGNVPDALAVLAYDAAKVGFNAMEKAKDLTGPAIAEALAATKGYKAVSGTINIDADHNPVKSAVVMKIEDNKAKYTATVNP